MVKNYTNQLDKLPFAMWGYRTLIRTSTGPPPYSLVYGMEAVLPTEITIPLLRIIVKSQIPESEWEKDRYKEL